MKTWKDIKQATLDKLFLEQQEAEDQNYLSKFPYLANECLNLISNGVKPKINVYEVTTTEKNEVVSMPEDFLSFSGMVNYVDDRPDPTIIYLSDKKIRLPEVGNYVIYYNATWGELPTRDLDDDYELDADPSVLNCLPTYIASQLLAQDDVQRSTILKNEFELLLSRLDTDIYYQQHHFKSTGGWY